MTFKYDKYLYSGCGDVFVDYKNIGYKEYVGKVLFNTCYDLKAPINKLYVLPDDDSEPFEIVGDNILKSYVIVNCVKKTNKLIETINKWGIGFYDGDPCCKGKITFIKGKDNKIYMNKFIEKV